MQDFLSKIKASPLTIAVVITIALLIIYYILPKIPAVNNIFANLEGKTVDFRFDIRGTERPGSEVVLVTIDEKSIKGLGRWPWDRDKIAKVIDILDGYGAKVIALDIVFAEPQGESQDDQDDDNKLAEAIKGSGKVILGYFLLMGRNETEHISLNEIEDAVQVARRHRVQLVVYEDEKSSEFEFHRSAAYPTNNIKILDTACASAGYFNMFPDSDGTVRKIPLILPLNENILPSLSLQILKKYFDLGNEGVRIDIAEDGVIGLRVGKIDVPTTLQGELLVNYRGDQESFPHYSGSGSRDEPGDHTSIPYFSSL